jgi:putative aldouronate transport system permease protein
VTLRYGKYDWISQVLIIALLCLVVVLCLYPLLYVFSMSISNPRRIAFETLWLLPKGFSLASYGRMITENPSIWRAYSNTILYTVAGTGLNVALTTCLAYALARKDFAARNIVMAMVTFTMLFSGGLIPLFVLVIKLGIYNTRWAMILPTGVAVWNTIIARTFFVGIPDSLGESAKIDGANDITILVRIIIPISAPIIAVLAIFYAVGHWNSYLSGLLYLPDGRLHPLQLFLARLLVNDEAMLQAGGEEALDMTYIQQQLKYVAIMITVLPIVAIYPLFQRFFVRGVMIGAIKG